MKGKRVLQRPWLLFYLALLSASFIVQIAWPNHPTARPGDLTVEVRRETATGPIDGKPVRISYTDVGEGPTLILIHGSPGSKTNFSRLAPLLTPHLRVITVDLPGFGGSTRWIPDYSIQAHARYVLDLMDALGVDHAQVLGYSMGAGVGLQMVAIEPERIDGLIVYGGVGVQEGEGSGDYYLEHVKYALGYGLLVIAPEGVAHFGLFGPRSLRHSFIRNFWDTDQRPLRAILEGLTPQRTPMLILHGRRDPLVPAWTAYQHHELVEHSELVMFDASHFMVFSDASAKQLTQEIIPFTRRHADGTILGAPRTLDHTAGRVEAPSPLPFGWDLKRGVNPWTQMGIIIVASYILEDPTTVFTGLMIAQGQIDPFVGVLAIFVGIFSGDLALYLFGYVVGRRVLRWPMLASRLPTRRVERMGDWFDRRGWAAVLASRFIPGTRLPLYVAAGALGRKPGRFALWTCLAVMIWAAAMILATVLFGEAVMSLTGNFVGRWLTLPLALLTIWAFIRVLTLLCTSIGRAKLKAGAARIWRWEFWPVWLFYPPVIPWIVWLSIRYRGFATLTAVNPGMPDGGFVNESKIDILNHLPRAWIIPSALVSSPEQLRQVMAQRGWSLPLILKPDRGERGYGVKKITAQRDIDEYFTRSDRRILAQTFDPGPFEAGVFYYRMPDASAGRIFSITDKLFPVLEGDGKHTLEQLIYRHPRHRMQSGAFLKRFGDDRDRVLKQGELLPLVIAGNHCQGAQFQDGAHLFSPELEKSIDQIAAAYEGFYFGRFDVRYRDAASFRAGRDFRIIELNGATSESTNIYDPRRSLISAYKTLWRQWSIAFQIASINRRRGAAVTPLRRLLINVVKYYRRRPRSGALAD